MKFSQYNILLDVEDSKYLVNTKNGQYVKFTNPADLEHYQELMSGKETLSAEDSMVKALVSRKYIVDDNTDEYAEVKAELDRMYEPANNVLTLFIYVTDNCNFRCKYCPQEHLPQKLPDELWNGLYKYIENALVTNEFKYVRLSFFGGEPLLESKKIINFLEKINTLKEKYPDFMQYCDITTNGYLLTPNLYDKLVSLGVKQFQITVDGFAETHDAVRPLADGSKTWDKIMEHIMYIAKAKDKAFVMFRTNVNNNMTKERQSEWFDWCMHNLPKEKFIFDIEQVVKMSDLVPDEYTFDKTKDEKLKMFVDIRKQTNDYAYFKIEQCFEYGGSVCESSKKGYFTISTDGKVAKCQALEIKEGIYIGELTPEGKIIFNSLKEKWNNAEQEKCRKCYAYPHCYARHCPYRITIRGEKYNCDEYLESYKNNLKEAIKKGVGKRI